MENRLLTGMKELTNYTYTTNGDLTHKSTLSDVLDMFAFGGAYRNKSENDVILLFKNAYAEDATLALKCLFYLRDVRGGQGERRFFRVAMKWLANTHPEAARRNLANVVEFGRWDDLLYTFVETELEKDALEFIRDQFILDMESETPSLLAKWMPSEGASAASTKAMAKRVREFLGLSHKEYRKALSALRNRIKVVERLMSENRWNEIKFDELPSQAGIKYRNAFARKDMIATQYKEFATNKETKVNASVLAPYEVVEKVLNGRSLYYGDGTERAMLNKYWDNLKDYFHGNPQNGLAVVDVSGSMTGRPMEVAISLGMYIAERGHGPFADHFITFSETPELVRFEGVDFVDKVQRCKKADWGYSTDLYKALMLILTSAVNNKLAQDELPEVLYIISDMHFDRCIYGNSTIEAAQATFESYGYKMPRVVFWNVNAAEPVVPAIGEGLSYVSGFSPSIFETLLSGKDGIDLMLEALMKERYSVVQ